MLELKGNCYRKEPTDDFKITGKNINKIKVNLYK